MMHSHHIHCTETCKTGARGESRDRRLQVNLLDAINAVNDPTVIVDQKGMVVFANEAFEHMHPEVNAFEAGTARVGTLASCDKSKILVDGCGTGPSCNYCGVKKTIIECLVTHRPVEREAWLTIAEGVDRKGGIFEIHANPIVLDSNRHVLVSIRDVSTYRTKTCINVSLIHYLINQIWGIEGLSQFLAENSPDEHIKTVATDIGSVSKDILDRVQEYRMLVSAESGSLKVKQSQMVLCDLIENLEDQVRAKFGRELTIRFRCYDKTVLVSDTELLLYALFNFVAKAISVARSDDAIHLRITKHQNECRFFVQFRSMAAKEEIEAMFSRLETGNGMPRRLDTYLARIYIERYLGGAVGCKSSPQFGTVLYIRLPVETVVAEAAEVA